MTWPSVPAERWRHGSTRWVVGNPLAAFPPSSWGQHCQSNHPRDHCLQPRRGPRDVLGDMGALTASLSERSTLALLIQKKPWVRVQHDSAHGEEIKPCGRHFYSKGVFRFFSLASLFVVKWGKKLPLEKHKH